MSNTAELMGIMKAPEVLMKYLPIRVVFRKQPDGNIHGLCEDSFSMSFSPTNVRIWWSGPAYSMLGAHHINGIDDAAHNTKDGDIVINPLSDDCPIEINWEAWLSATRKYEQRNAPFTVKGELK